MNTIASFAALFVVALGYGVILPLAPGLVGRSMGTMTPETASFHTGALGAVYLFAFAALAPAWGRVVDVSSPRRVAAGGLSGFALSFAAMALAGRVEITYAALAAAGACAAAVVPAIQVQIGRERGDAARARLVAGLGAASFAGSFLGPGLAGVVSERTQAWSGAGIDAPLALVALLGMAAAVLALRALCDGQPDPGRGEPGAVSRARAPLAWRFGLLSMAVAFGIGGFEVSLVLWLAQVMRLDARLVSSMLVECSVVMMAVQAAMFFVPMARPRWKPSTACIAFVAMAGAVALTPAAFAAWTLFLYVGIVAATATLLQSMLSLGTVATAGPSIGAALGLQLSLASLGQGAGSLAAGRLFSASGSGFIVVAAALALAGVAALVPLSDSARASPSR